MVDREQLYRWWCIFHNDLTEVRIVCSRGKTYSGYYKDFGNLLRDVETYDGVDGANIYFSLNQINPDCYSRTQCEHLEASPKNTTSDGDIIARRWVLVDFDPKRPTDISSSDAELEKAHMKAIAVFRYLREQGFTEPVVAMSGNGYHLQLPCLIGVRDETDTVIKRFLQSLSMMFSDGEVDVDEKVFNRSRICKVYGTTAKKGANTADRPWRVSRILRYPSEITPTDISYFKKVADLYPEDQPKPSSDNHYGRERFDLVRFMQKHGIGYRAQAIAGGTKYILDHCVFNPEHKGHDACIFQRDNGAIGYVCFHNSCSHYTWKDVRLKFEPDAYDRKDYREYQYKQRYFGRTPTLPPFEPAKETEKQGKKWLQLSEVSIKPSDEQAVIPFGYFGLDRALRGMILGEVTLLSGNNGSGKSSWINCVVLNAIERGFKSAIWSGELPPHKVKSWICQCAAGLSNVVKNPNFDNVFDTDPKVVEKVSKWLDSRLYLYNNNYGNRWEQILSDMEEIVDRQGVSLIVLDNLMALNIDGKDGDKNDRQKQFIQDVVKFAERKVIHVLIVAHPNKTAYNTLLRKESISGTSDLTNAVQRVMIIHRVGEDFKRRASEFFGATKAATYYGFDNVIEVCKDREYGGQDFIYGMYYEPQTRRFKNSKAEYAHYGWEEEPWCKNVPYRMDEESGELMPFKPPDGSCAPF